MKAVILERRGRDAAVLAENGTFIKVRKAGDVGEEIEIKEQSAPIRIWRSGAAKMLAAAAIVLALIGGSYHYMTVSVSAYVSIDAGGSSVELAVNRLGRVTTVRPVTESDSELAETLSVTVGGMSVEDAVNKALGTIMENGETVSDDKPVIVGITSGLDSQAEQLESSIKNNVELPVRTVRVSENEREEAHKQDIGGGAYVCGTEDTAEAVITEEQCEDNSSVTTATEIKVIPVFETEQPMIEMQETTAAETPSVTENDNIIQPADNSKEQPAVTAPPEQRRTDEAPRQSELPSDEAPQDRPEMQKDTDPAVGTEDPPQQNEQQQNNIPPAHPAEQNVQEQQPPASDESASPPQSGQQPDNMPPEQSGAQSGQEPKMSVSGENKPQEHSAAMYDTMIPPAMSESDAFGQR